MNRSRLAAFVGAAVLLAYVALVWLIPHAPSAETCAHDQEGNPHGCEQWDILTSALRWLVLRADEHNGVVTAFASLFIAVFTGVLWQSTDKLWKSAERATLEQHRPWVFVKDVVWVPARSCIDVVFYNSGLTPAREFKKGIVARLLPVPFPSSPLPELEDGYSSFLPPGGSEALTVSPPSAVMGEREYLIRIAISYRLQDGSVDTLYQDFSYVGTGSIRKVTPKDFAAHRGIDTYTVGESYEIPE